LQYDREGNQSALVEIGAGEWAIWLGCFSDQPVVQDLYSSPKAECLAIPVETLINVSDRYPQIYRRVINEIGVRYRLLIEWSEQSKILNSEKRLLKTLVMYARFSSATQNTMTLSITQDRLGKLTGLTRQTVNLLLKQLQQKNLIDLGYGKIKIASIAKLERYILE
jgi:CRP-like cAMP-binding protein